MYKTRCKITINMAKKFVELYEKENKSSTEIAKMYNCSVATVINYLKLLGANLSPKGKGRPRRQFYKKNFLIALYDLEENLVGVFDNVYELSKYSGKSVNAVRYCLTPKALQQKIRINGKWYRKELIEVI